MIVTLGSTSTDPAIGWLMTIAVDTPVGRLVVCGVDGLVEGGADVHAVAKSITIHGAVSRIALLRRKTPFILYLPNMGTWLSHVPIYL